MNAYLNRGSAYTYRGDVECAIADYTRVLEIDAKHVFAYVDRSNAYLKGRDYDRAIADATKAIRMDSSCEQAYQSPTRASRRAKSARGSPTPREQPSLIQETGWRGTPEARRSC